MNPTFALTSNQMAGQNHPERYGLDPFADPKTLIVPFEGEQLIGLYHSAGMSIAESDSSIIKIVKDEPGAVSFERRIILKGISVGTAFIEVRRNNIVLARLEIAVLKRKQIRLSFHFVEDNFNHRTKRSPAQTFALISEINKIYLPQTNIEFISRLSRTVKVGINLGNQVNFPGELYKGEIKTGQKEWNAITKLRDDKANINIFFVHLLATDEYLRHCKKFKRCGGSDLKGYHAFKNCMINDDIEANELAVVTAHEIGHALGIVHHNPKNYYLMGELTTTESLISKTEALAMNLSFL